MRFPFVVSITHAVNELVTDIILNITSQEHLMLTLFYIGTRLFELLAKTYVYLKKQPGMPLSVPDKFKYKLPERRLSCVYVIKWG